ncbi:universal stress protein [Catellatospora sp. KI3]|uniref:universal stress protein n=1 Tax=Catellatospora sp. KI3 TaxID=3041620 RepID=UPI00248267CF|nr:universal stress protein [Catellatospora sp. KI3]MDI1461153.1 universal stress protein [Catellatospora sp. KI3]
MNTIDDPRGPVVVGVDGSDSSLLAVRLGAQEAVLRRLPLRLVHAFIWPLMNVNTGPSESGPATGGLRHDAERILADAHAAAVAAAPSVPVTAELLTGAPAPVLMHAAKDASLLVLGDRGLGGFTGLLVGSVAVHCTQHGHTPVLVARGTEHPGGPVVVGVDAELHSATAIDAAFAEAELRRAELMAVHTWTRHSGHGHEPVPGAVHRGEPHHGAVQGVEPHHGAVVREETAHVGGVQVGTIRPGAPGAEPIGTAILRQDHATAAVAEKEGRSLAEALAAVRERHPDVAVREHLVRGRPARVLVELSEQAQLVVVGGRGCGGFTGLVMGSVSHQVLHHARCPVLLVPRPAA